jgi:hypothetical protein
MALEVHELRAEDLADAQALWQAGEAGQAFDALRQSPGSLLLVGREEGKLVAVAASVRDAGKGHVLQVAVKSGDDADTLRTRITGIALRKLRARGISTCHVAPGPADDPARSPFFASLRYAIPPASGTDAA